VIIGRKAFVISPGYACEIAQPDASIVMTSLALAA
jgi:hypothetical protein